MLNASALRKAILSAMLLATAGIAHAQSYPTRPVRMIIGFTPGTTTDILARIVGQKLGESLGQPVIVETRVGAGGGIAAEQVARATPDGYTLLLGSSSQLIFSPSINRKLPYDALKDFAHIITIAQAQNVLVVHPSMAANSVKDLISVAKARTGQLNYASTGKGTTSQLSAELFKRMTGTEIVEISYKSAAQASADLIAGQVSLGFPSLSPTIPHIKAGKLRALAVTSSSRSRAMPELPTMAEAGVAGYEVTAIASLAAPARTPRTIVIRLNKEVNQILLTPEVRLRMSEQGAETAGGTPEELTLYIKDGISKWSQLVDKIGLKPD